MLGRQDVNTDLFQCVTMESLVPPNHVLRKLYAALNLDFVRERVKSLYSSVGRRSADPEVVVRMWVLQHLHGFSEREICDEVTMHAGFRWFCGLSFNDPVPDQSTLVKLRNHKWSGTDLWDDVLEATVRACEAAGICRPGRMGVDGTIIIANAATVSLESIPPKLEMMEAEGDIRDVADPPLEPPLLRIEEGGRPQGCHRSGDPNWHGEKFSNATHRSTTDPEARLYRKGANREAKLSYLGHYLSELSSGVIYQAMATQATGTAEREAALMMLDRCAVMPSELAADLGYRDGAFLARVIERGVTPLVPLGEERLEQEPIYKRATYNIEVAEKRKQKVTAARARNLTRIAARGPRGRRAQFQRTRLEHLFGEAKEHHGLRRAHGRGLKRVDQQVKMTAAVQNLKRLMASRGRRADVQAAALTSWGESANHMRSRLMGRQTRLNPRRQAGQLKTQTGRTGNHSRRGPKSNSSSRF